MAMREIWIPSPNYSTSRGPYNKIVLHTTEGAQTIESLGNFFASPSAGVSSHFGADNKQRGVVGAYVYESHKAWTQGNANPYCLSMELCTPSGAASNWSRDYWLNQQNTLVRNAADWVAWMAGKYNIPIVALTPSQAQNAGVKGVCQHRDLGAWGGSHHDCGNGFPMDQVIAWAKGGTPTPAPDTGGFYMSSSMAFDSKGGRHYAAVWDEPEKRVNYRAPGGSWVAVDPGSRARSGADITISSGDLIVITYTNSSGQVCTYSKPVSGGSWAWANVGPTGGKVML